jgi:hypothetical protein
LMSIELISLANIQHEVFAPVQWASHIFSGQLCHTTCLTKVRQTPWILGYYHVCWVSLLENPLTFFTNTCRPLQHLHLSFSTKKDCIFSRNTVVNIDVAPHLLVCHIIT